MSNQMLHHATNDGLRERAASLAQTCMPSGACEYAAGEDLFGIGLPNRWTALASNSLVQSRTVGAINHGTRHATVLLLLDGNVLFNFIGHYCGLPTKGGVDRTD